MEVRNPKRRENGDISCEIEHPTLGWQPFTASPNDPEPFGRALFELIENSGETIPDYEPPEAAADDLPI